MRSHEEATYATSIRFLAKKVGAAAACLFTILILLFLAGPVSAATVTDRPLLFTIDGATVPGGPMVGASSAAVDNATGALYLSERGHLVNAKDRGRIYRFHPDGTPWPFSSTGLPYIEGTADFPMVGAGVAVDNSGGANQSRLYASDFSGQKIYVFDPNGQLLASVPLTEQPYDAAVDPAGHPYTIGISLDLRKYANSGLPPALISTYGVHASALDVNAAEDAFLIKGAGELEKWVGGSFTSTVDTTAFDVYLDQSVAAGDIFTTYGGYNEEQQISVTASAGQFRLSFGGSQTSDLPFNATGAQIQAALESLPTVGAGNAAVVGAKTVIFRGLLAHADVPQLLCESGTTPLSGGSCTVSTTQAGTASDFQEYTSAGALLNTFGVGLLDNARSVAYNPSLDRVYVFQRATEEESSAPVLAAFGPAVSGTVADLTIDPPTAVGISSAHFGGTVNPQGTSSEWRFQWRKGGQGWITASSSPAQALPADSSNHSVEFTTNALRGATTYQVRLVAVNTANQLLAASETKTFTTTKAAQAPAVTISSATAITSSGVTISGTVNPHGDTADWRVQTSTDPTCAGGYTDQPLQEVTPASASPVNVQYTITGLLPAQQYCARITATNSVGTTTSSVQQFKTQDAMPTQVFTAYAAPRTDTGARLNGYVNPEGSDATYHFEYSADGSNWTSLPDEQTREERVQITAASELSGLEPATTYHYRFVVENDAGTVEGDEMVFTTRTSAEMQLPQRGIELVNQADKGNQNLALSSRPTGDPDMVSRSGDRAVWTTTAGVPGGTTGTDVNFLARRTAAGWVSAPLVPPADQQIGEGGYAYKLNALSADLRSFVFRAGESGVFEEGPPTLVRIDDEQHQDVLASFDQTFASATAYEGTDMTTDADHVLFPNPETHQLEELGESPEVISIMPDGLPSNCGVAGAQFAGAADSGSGSQWRYGYHRMSITDASRVYFQSIPNGDPCSEPRNSGIYYRDRVAGQTTEVDPGGVGQGAGMIRATPDGGSLYFLTATSHLPTDANTKTDIYRWDAVSGNYTCMTCLVADAGIPIRNQGYPPVRISDDFSHIYFTSTNQLVPGYGTPGASNIYVLSGGMLKFVATDARTDVSVNLVHADLSEDGDVLIFPTFSGGGYLAADPVAEHCASQEGGQNPQGCNEIYRYEASAESLECLTCNPNGLTTKDAGSSGTELYFGVSDDGSTVAVITREALVPQDINGTADVYQWRNGAVGLVSDGETQYPDGGFFAGPKVYGVDATGDNIFFSLIDPDLTGYEKDNLSNLYDARVGGGFPRPTEPAHCSEESCQGPLQVPPSVEQSASAGNNGAGNLSPAPSCAGNGRQARRLSQDAAKLRREAKRLAATDAHRARLLQKKATLLQKRADRLGQSERRCKRASRGAAK